jgi:hypothetical protein
MHTQSQTLHCGCQLDWNGRGFDLTVCGRHRKEYFDAYGVDSDE